MLGEPPKFGVQRLAAARKLQVLANGELWLLRRLGTSLSSNNSNKHSNVKTIKFRKQLFEVTILLKIVGDLAVCRLNMPHCGWHSTDFAKNEEDEIRTVQFGAVRSSDFGYVGYMLTCLCWRPGDSPRESVDDFHTLPYTCLQSSNAGSCTATWPAASRSTLPGSQNGRVATRALCTISVGLPSCAEPQLRTLPTPKKLSLWSLKVGNLLFKFSKSLL